MKLIFIIIIIPCIILWKEILELIYGLIYFINQFFCFHKRETSNEIDNGTICEINCWCSKCGKNLN